MEGMLRTKKDFLSLKLNESIYGVNKDNQVVKYTVIGIKQERHMNGQCWIFFNKIETKCIHIQNDRIYRRGVDFVVAFTDLKLAKIYALEEKIKENSTYCKKYAEKIKIKKNNILKFERLIKALKTGEL